MKLTFVIALLFSMTAAYPDTFPTFEIDLDLPPEERFVKVASHFKVPIALAFDQIVDALGKLAGPVMTFFDYTAWIWNFTQTEKARENERNC